MIRKGYVDTDMSAKEIHDYIEENVHKALESRILKETIVRQEREIEWLNECLEEVKKDKKYYESMYKAMRELVDRKGF